MKSTETYLDKMYGLNDGYYAISAMIKNSKEGLDAHELKQLGVLIDLVSKQLAQLLAEQEMLAP